VAFTTSGERIVGALAGMPATDGRRSLSAYLELDSVEVAFGSFTALHALSLSIAKGEFFCLLGPSGCGKSTTLSVIAGLMRPSRGRVMLAGEDVTVLPTQRRNIGIVFQSYALFPHMTVAENVGYGLRIKKRPAGEISARVSELLDLVRLTGKGERFPRQLSGGEQQRVAIARALAPEPRLLLLDEPLSNLDARLREEMRDELRRIQRTTNVTTVFVTHDQEEAITTSDRIAVLNQGRIEQLGTPAEIYRNPQTNFVARFIGRSNRLTGIVQAGNGHKMLRINGSAFAVDHPASDGGSHVLFLRPEEIAIPAPSDAPNRLQGVVTEITYGGLIQTVHLKTEVGDLEVCQLGGSAPAFSVGDTATVGWTSDAGALLPEE
jgi:putative spermidine/putrescine transport system ATP-binding protein